MGSPDGQVTMADAFLLLRVAWGMARLPESGLSLSERLDAGFAALDRKDLLTARDEFLAATVIAGDVQSNDADTARFLGAVYRIAASVEDLETDGVEDDGLNTLGGRCATTPRAGDPGTKDRRIGSSPVHRLKWPQPRARQSLYHARVRREWQPSPDRNVPLLASKSRGQSSSPGIPMDQIWRNAASTSISPPPVAARPRSG